MKKGRNYISRVFSSKMAFSRHLKTILLPRLGFYIHVYKYVKLEILINILVMYYAVYGIALQ